MSYQQFNHCRLFCLCSARGTDQRLRDQQHRFHQPVLPGDAAEGAGLRALRLHQEPLQYLRRRHRGHQVSEEALASQQPEC